MPLRIPLYFGLGYMIINQLWNFFSYTFVDLGWQAVISMYTLAAIFENGIAHCILYVTFHIIDHDHIFIILVYTVDKSILNVVKCSVNGF